MADEFPKVSPEELQRHLRNHIRADKPLCVLAGPGVGKSRIVEQVVLEELGVPFHPFIGSTRQPTDLMGFPFPDQETKKMRWYPPGEDDLPQKAPGAIFADEITAAPVLVQSALLQLFGKERRAGSYHCPEGVARIAAGNRPEDKTGAGRLITALGNRMSVFELVVSVKEWCKWARAAKVDERIIAYIAFNEKSKKSALIDWDSNRVVNATPRAWEEVSDLMKVMGEGNPDRQAMMGARVGMGHAADAESYFRLFGKIQDPDEVLKHPDKAEVYKTGTSEGLGLTFALCAALAGRCKKETGKAILQYADRLSPEFALCLVEDAKVVDMAAIANTAEHQKFVTKHPELYK